MKNKFDLNDLPRFSPWPARLLGIKACPQHWKTSAQVIREYEHEKWAPLLNRIKLSNRPISIKAVDRWFFENIPKTNLGIVDGKLRTISFKEYHQMYLDIIEMTLKKFLPASAIVELGCGYGSVILNLAQRKIFSKVPLLAADFVPSALRLTQEIAQHQKVTIRVGSCDLGSKIITDLPIPEGAIIFTSHAALYVPWLRNQFIRGIAKFRPRAVIHFEPCYEHGDKMTLLGLMKSRYMEINDYNRNLVSFLHRQQKNGKIRILTEQADVIGSNALLPASIIAWKSV